MVIPAGELEMCFNISINVNEIHLVSFKQFMLVLNVTKGTMVIPGVNDSITFTIFNAEESTEPNKNNGINFHQNFTQNSSILIKKGY